jgi:REP element-mobilizing transposase RayT
MPRQSRIDIPGLLHHVIVRGIEQSTIFHDDDDRHNFLDRLQTLLVETETECLAWALIPNHFHLLLYPRRSELSRFMRCLLTGYAVTFNHRHGRSGHLFQNRYKSIVCEENKYLLELIRYIHLNPLRAGLVKDLDELDHYPWCGHAGLLGKGRPIGLATETILPLFSQRKKMARKNYRQFIADGVVQGHRPELVGGGLRRSQAHQVDSVEPQDYDARVLGSGDFVSALRGQGLLGPATPLKMNLEVLRPAVASHFEITEEKLQQRSRGGKISQARAVYCYCATRKLNYSGTLIGRFLGMGSSSVSRAAQRGEKLVQENDGVRIWLENLLKQ